MNSPAIGVLQTGTYLISNAKNKNNIIMPDDAEKKAPIIARSDPKSKYSRWNVTLLSNGNYNILNFQFPTRSATSSATAAEGDEVVALASRVQQWVIREGATRGNYLISPLDGEHFWGLTDDEEETTLSLATVPNNKRNQWNFTHVRV